MLQSSIKRPNLDLFNPITSGQILYSDAVSLKGKFNESSFVRYFVKQLLLVPLDNLRNTDFNAEIEELFDLTGDSPLSSLPGSFDSSVYSTLGGHKFDFPVYSLLGSRDLPVYLIEGRIDSAVYLLPGTQKFDSMVYSRLGGLNPPPHPCIRHGGVIFTLLSCLSACHDLKRNNH
jgi:hypothetical protein